MPYVTEVSLFAAGFIAAYAYGNAVMTVLVDKTLTWLERRRG